VVSENGQEALVSNSGERFPIRNGIPPSSSPKTSPATTENTTTSTRLIGGFYDDVQRVFGAFRGLELDSYFENYMSLLEVKAGDSVLETSVGTGLNFKYLPRGDKALRPRSLAGDAG
jgi:hypothetical protein